MNAEIVLMVSGSWGSSPAPLTKQKAEAYLMDFLGLDMSSPESFKVFCSRYGVESFLELLNENELKGLDRKSVV